MRRWAFYKKNTFVKQNNFLWQMYIHPKVLFCRKVQLVKHFYFLQFWIQLLWPLLHRIYFIKRFLSRDLYYLLSLSLYLICNCRRFGSYTILKASKLLDQPAALDLCVLLALKSSLFCSRKKATWIKSSLSLLWHFCSVVNSQLQ